MLVPGRRAGPKHRGEVHATSNNGQTSLNDSRNIPVFRSEGSRTLPGTRAGNMFPNIETEKQMKTGTVQVVKSAMIGS